MQKTVVCHRIPPEQRPLVPTSSACAVRQGTKRVEVERGGRGEGRKGREGTEAPEATMEAVVMDWLKWRQQHCSRGGYGGCDTGSY
jgi:hypothetical protein